MASVICFLVYRFFIAASSFLNVLFYLPAMRQKPEERVPVHVELVYHVPHHESPFPRRIVEAQLVPLRVQKHLRRPRLPEQPAFLLVVLSQKDARLGKPYLFRISFFPVPGDDAVYDFRRFLIQT